MQRLLMVFIFLFLISSNSVVLGSIDSLSYYYARDDYKNALRHLKKVETTALTDQQYADYCIIGAELNHYRGDFNKAIEFFDRGRKIKWLDKEDEIEILMSGFKTYIDIADRKNAEPIFGELEKKIEKHDVDSALLLKYNLLVVNYFDLIGEREKSMRYALKALNLIDASGTLAHKTSIYITIGEIMRTNNKPQKALKYYAKAEEIARKEKLYNALGKIYNNQSIVAKDAGDITKSLEKLENSARMYRLGRGEVAAAPAYYNLGIQYIDAGEHKRGQKYIRKVLDIGIANGFDKAKYFGFYGMGYYYDTLNQFEEAEHYYLKALEIAKLQKNPPNSGRVYESLYKLYDKNNLSEKALKYYVLNHEIIDSLKISENEAVIEGLEAKYQLAQKEKENKALRLKQTHQRFSFFVGGGIILILIIVLVFLYVTLRNKRRQNKLLALQKEQIDNKNNQLSELNEAVLEQKQQLEEVNHIKDSMFSIISHDLRSPLSSVYMLMRMINEQGLDTEKGLSMVKELSREVNQSLFLLNNLMIWANINIQEIQPYFESFSVQSIVDEAVSFFKNDLEFKKLTINTKLDENLQVWADLNMTQSVLQNLLSNAIKFSDDSGEIEIKATQEADKVCIAVEDYGVGIAPEEINEILEPAVRLQKGTLGERGVGLGLHISNIYMQAMEGELKIVEKQPGTRAEVWFILGD
ncbi:ATP-binding protein [Salinivirga cyanobacteriivorans]|nr:ATP-binding protein [Salinivirga cyanobacteriivorans]